MIYICSNCFNSHRMFLWIWLCSPVSIFVYFCWVFGLLDAGKPITLKRSELISASLTVISFSHLDMPTITSQLCLTSMVNLATIWSLFHVFLSIFSGLHLEPSKSTSIATRLSSPPEVVFPLPYLILPSKVVLVKLLLVMMRDGDAGFPLTTPQFPFNATISSTTFKENIYPLTDGCYPTIRLGRHPSNFIYPIDANSLQ